MKLPSLFFILCILVIVTFEVSGQGFLPANKKSLAEIAKYAYTPNAPTRITRKIKKTKDGALLMAAYDGIFRFEENSFVNLTKKYGLSTCHAFDVLETKNGDIWIATDDDGAYLFNGQSFTHYTTEDGLAHDRLMQIYEDHSGNIWLSTMGGLSLFDGESFKNYSTKDGLPHDNINTVFQDSLGKFWIGTREGLSWYDGESFSTVLDKNGNPFVGIVSIIEDQDGKIWLGGKDGVWNYEIKSTSPEFSHLYSVATSYLYEDSNGKIWVNSSGWINKDQPNTHDWALLFVNELGSFEKIGTDSGMFFGIQEDNKGGIWVGTLQGVFRYDGMNFTIFHEKSAKK